MVCFGLSYSLSGFEKQDPEAAMVAPLLEAWCDEKSPLGEIGMDFNRDVFRFTEKDDLSLPDTVKMARYCARRGFHGRGRTWRTRMKQAEIEFDELESRAWSGLRHSAGLHSRRSHEEDQSRSSGPAIARAGGSRSSWT